MKKNILVIGQLPPPFHGSNVMTKYFCSTLEELGYSISIAEKTFSTTIDEVEKFTLKKIARAPIVLLKIIRKIVNTKMDLCFYFISIKPPSFYIDSFLMFLLKITNNNTVLYIHGKGFKSNSKKYYLMKWILKSSIFTHPLGAFVLGDKLKDDVDFFIDKKNLFRLNNCIPEDKNNIYEKFVKKHSGGRGIQILYLSNLVPAKGPVEFIEMAKILSEKLTTVRFVIAGAAQSSAFSKELNRLITAYNLKDRVEMVGAVYGEEKEKLFLGSDIFVFPSYYDLEAFPLVNIEAMRAGLPIITSNEGCISEAVIHGMNGYIIDPHNPFEIAEFVLKLINNVELRKNMSANSRIIYEENYTSKKYKKRLKKGLRKFLKN